MLRNAASSDPRATRSVSSSSSISSRRKCAATRPCASTVRSSATDSAWRKLWVMRITAWPWSRAWAIWSSTRPAWRTASAEVGSSRMRSDEPKNIARAIASDWRSPPEMLTPRSSRPRSQRTPRLVERGARHLVGALQVEPLERAEALLRLAAENDVAGHRQELADREILEDGGDAACARLRRVGEGRPARRGSAARRGRAGRRRRES